MGATFSCSKKVGEFQPTFLRMLERKSSVELLEFSSAISKRGESLSEDPSGEPLLRRCKAFKSLNGLEPAIELLVHALNEIRSSRTIDVEDDFGMNVRGELLTALEYMVHCCDLYRIILMTGRTPADPGF